VFFVALNNWQRGDYKPYIVRSDDRGKTWKNITGDLPAKHDVWAVAQDHVNPNLLFAGTEFGLFFTVDGGSKWVQLKGGMPAAQVRDLSARFAKSQGRLDALLASGDSVLAKINHGQGSLGLLANNPSLYRQSDSLVVALRELITDIRANPKKYVSIRLF